MAEQNYYIEKKFSDNQPDFLNSILESTPVCVKVFDKNLRLVFMNARGLSEHMLTASSDFDSYDYFASIIEADREKIKQAARDAFNGKVQFIEFEHVPGLSKQRWCFSVASLLRTAANNAPYIILSSMDFTEHARTETVVRRERRMFKLLLDATPLCIKWFDNNGNLISVNKAGREEHFLLNKTDEEIRQWNYWGCIDSQYYDTIKQNLNAAINNKETEPFLFKHVPGTSHGLWCKSFIRPVKNENDQVELILFISQDITKEKEFEDIKATHIAELEQWNKTKSEYVSLVAHQLGSPISAINWCSEILLGQESEKKLAPEQEKYVQEIYATSKRMAELVKAFLDTAQIEMGIFVVKLEPIKISKIIDSVLEEHAEKIAKKGQLIVRDYDLNEPIVNIDQKLMRIVIQNLISNSVKYTPEKGKITIMISQNGNDIEILVADTGYGTPVNQKEKVFSKFFRADNIISAEKSGTGLGLYIVKGILEKTGGSIRFESEENKGTTFYVNIPLAGMKNVES